MVAVQLMIEFYIDIGILIPVFARRPLPKDTAVSRDTFPITLVLLVSRMFMCEFRGRRDVKQT